MGDWLLVFHLVLVTCLPSDGEVRPVGVRHERPQKGLGGAVLTFHPADDVSPWAGFGDSLEGWPDPAFLDPDEES